MLTFLLAPQHRLYAALFLAEEKVTLDDAERILRIQDALKVEELRSSDPESLGSQGVKSWELADADARWLLDLMKTAKHRGAAARHAVVLARELARVLDGVEPIRRVLP
jgi:hypothetical protein